jgi:hypothetical protein
MPVQIAQEQFMTAFHTLLEETFEQVRGSYYLDKGTSLFETLETISAEEASRPVSACCASIAGQVEHICFFLELAARYGRGEVVGQVDWQASWQRVGVTPEEWEALKGRLREAHQNILAVASNPATWEIEGAIGGGMAMMMHTAYHLGEIRQALCTVRGCA